MTESERITGLNVRGTHGFTGAYAGERLHKHAKCARHCVQINFPLLYPDVSDTVPVAVSIKILMLPVISLSLAVAWLQNRLDPFTI